jgi:hypothetical protein
LSRGAVNQIGLCVLATKRENDVVQIEERFLSAQADTFAGANVKENASACSVRNDGGFLRDPKNEDG